MSKATTGRTTRLTDGTACKEEGKARLVAPHDAEAREFSPFGVDPLSELLRERVRELIEEVIEQEVDAALGAGSYERIGTRRGFRHGHASRTISTSFGSTELDMPRARLMREDGRKEEWHSAVIGRYQRRTADVDNAVVGLYLSGANTRRIKGALRPLLKGAPLSKSAISRLVTRIKGECDAWRNRSLENERFPYLYLDGFSLKVRCGGKVVGMTILGVVGVREDGQKTLVSLDLAAGESEASWRSLLEGLVARGLKEPRLCVVDGCPGLQAALRSLWRDVRVQRCTVHKLRNLLAKAPHHMHDAIRDDYHAIVYAKTEAEGRTAYERFVTRYEKQCQKVVESLREAGEELLTFFSYPSSQWKSLRTTNVIERVHEEFRRRVKTQASLPDETSAINLLVALVLSGQIRMWRINGCEDMDVILRRDMKEAC